MKPLKHLDVPATYMRGGTSKGVFFRLEDLPPEAQMPGEARDRLLLRVIGSPDPYGKQIDGMGGATSSTSKTVIVSASERPDHDIDYLFGQVSIDQAFVDWSGNCGNLSAAVGAFAIHSGIIPASRLPENGLFSVRIWQANIEKTIVAHIPISGGEVQEFGDFFLDGVTFPAAEISLEFMAPADGDDALFPSGSSREQLEVAGLGSYDATLINAGIPTVFVWARDLGLEGTELQDSVNSNAELLERLERIRAAAALKMGLIHDLAEAESRQHTPKVAFVAPAASYEASSGKTVSADAIDLCIRALSMGRLHHAMMGTAAVAIGVSATIPGTLVNEAAGGRARTSVRFGHPSGTLSVGAEAELQKGEWLVRKAVMSRSARVLMSGCVRIPVEVV